MSSMTYRDIPVLRGYGFKASPSGYSWEREDKDGNLWVVMEEDLSPFLNFSGTRMGREKFDELFGKAS